MDEIPGLDQVNKFDLSSEQLDTAGLLERLLGLAVEPRAAITAPEGIQLKLALFVDVETTGLDHTKDEIIELAMVPFTYGSDGRIYEVRKPFQRFHQPKSPIPAEITRLTGITDEMVAGHVINTAEVTAFAEGTALIIAHNAGFDRRFLERLSDTFCLKPWACSQSQIDWAGEGLEGTRLECVTQCFCLIFLKTQNFSGC
jgi:DNA polymerase-3 subunit epsilon